MALNPTPSSRRTTHPLGWGVGPRSLLQGTVLGLLVGFWLITKLNPGSWPQLLSSEAYAITIFGVAIATITSATLAILVPLFSQEASRPLLHRPLYPVSDHGNNWKSRYERPPVPMPKFGNGNGHEALMPGFDDSPPEPELAAPRMPKPNCSAPPNRSSSPGDSLLHTAESNGNGNGNGRGHQSLPDWLESTRVPVGSLRDAQPMEGRFAVDRQGGTKVQDWGPDPLSIPEVEVKRGSRTAVEALRFPGDYLPHWGLLQCPFENTPDPRYYFPSSHHQEALTRLLYGVQARKGAVMLTGEIGCGKTLMSRALLQQLPADTYDTALIAAPAFEATHLLREILYQLGVDSVGTGVDLLHRLNDRLLENYKRGLDTVLIIDEAQAIRDERMFEEIRLMLNFQLNDRFLLTLVLLGQPELKARVESITQLSQRIAIRHHLSPFTAQETAEYVRYRINLAGGHKETFTDEACFLIHSETGGIPRRINSLCDLCLLIGFMDHVRVIDRSIVLRAGAEITLGRRR